MKKRVLRPWIQNIIIAITMIALFVVVSVNDFDGFLGLLELAGFAIVACLGIVILKKYGKVNL